MPKIKIEMEVMDAQELLATVSTKARNIDWILENRPPRKADEAEKLDLRAKHLTLIALLIEKALNERVLNGAK